MNEVNVRFVDLCRETAPSLSELLMNSFAKLKIVFYKTRAGIFFSTSSLGKIFRINTSSYLNDILPKDSVPFKARKTLKYARIGSENYSRTVYPSFSTSVRPSVKYNSARGPSQSFCILFQTSLSEVKMPCSFTAATVPYNDIISRRNSADSFDKSISARWFCGTTNSRRKKRLVLTWSRMRG